ncbi:hypothetical protein L873DRAFT_1815877 [Choiromyces venosus 120613-1]|uniref:Uncharacterized protein n=1 Tax=Choiromyces venosus 120613-1 TaxID=1336337 RepID=A0A3N4J813_9PEZI|nr:hypothetical protein L873DRAFT_1815877 [Choiromyces venosus 120613-1]
MYSISPTFFFLIILLLLFLITQILITQVSTNFSLCISIIMTIFKLTSTETVTF